MKANLYPGRGTWPDWNDLEIRQREQMPPHAYRIPFPDLASCRHALADNRRYLSSFIINLTDGWESRFYPDILQLPENILSFRSGFEPAIVPGGRPAESAKASPAAAGQYPFPVTPPLVPSVQPVQVYRRTCRLPLLWGGLRKRLVMQGISAACHVFANGKLIGYSQGSCLPAEFDLTASLHDGENELFILTYPRCTGSYLEKQEPGGLFGLVRDIYFEAVPAICIQDIQIRTLPAPEEDGWRLDLAISLISYRISTDSPQVRISLCQGEEVLSDTTWPVPLQPAGEQDFASPVQTTGILKASLLIPDVEPWSDESPTLYDLYVSVEERGGRELTSLHQAVGFRQLTWQDGQTLLNGRPIQIRAAQLSRQQPMPIRDMISNLQTLRQSNLNALYLRNYPADPIFLELCDIFGVYIIDEAPLEASHPLMLAELRQDPRWQAMIRETLERLIRRDFNHPSVIFWSAGLFRQPGPLTDEIANYVRQLDETRGLHLIDLPDLGRELAETPLAAQMAYPIGGGQCFCDWNRRSPKLLLELKQFLRPLDILPIDAASGAFLVVNRLNWTPASQYHVDWLLLRDGHPILTGELDNIRPLPGAEQYVELLYGEQPFDDGADYVLRFTVTYAESGLFAEVGDEVFFREFPLSGNDRSDQAAPPRTGGRLRLESERHHLIISGSRFWLVFNRINGTLESWRYGDKELIAAAMPSSSALAGMHGSINRLPEPMDEPWLSDWQRCGYGSLIPQVISTREGCDGQSAVIEMVIRLAAAGLPACLEMLIRYEIRAGGDLRVFTGLTPLQPDLPPWPCFSLGMNLKPEYDQVSWLGTGPEPCLTRLQNSKRSGLFTVSMNTRDREENPQDDCLGLYPDTRWLSFKDKTGFGLLVRSDQLFGFAMRPVGTSGLTAGWLDRQALGIQLFAPRIPGTTARPVKASWHFTPVVSDAGRQP